MNLRQITQLTSGVPNSEVILTFHPAVAPDPSVRHTVSLIRAALPSGASRARADVIRIANPNGERLPLGVITLPSFYGEVSDDGGKKTNASKDVAQLLDRLKSAQVAGLVLDLRENGGGFLTEAIGITGLFVGDGPIVQVRNYAGNTSQTFSPEQHSRFTGPLIVLVDGRSAAASEIVAGALRDYGRAIIVGARTHGDGTIQTVLEERFFLRALAESHEGTGAVKITIKKFFLPDGFSPQFVGITPDILLPFAEDCLVQREDHLPRALPGERIPACAFAEIKIPAHLVEILRGQSVERQNRLADIVAEREMSEWLESCSNRPVSLDLDRRRRQIDDDEEHRKRYDAERLALDVDQRSFTAMTLTGRGDLAMDVQLRESLRILHDAILARWMSDDSNNVRR